MSVQDYLKRKKERKSRGVEKKSANEQVQTEQQVGTIVPGSVRGTHSVPQNNLRMC